MSQVEWGPSMETTNGTRRNVNGGKLENNISRTEASDFLRLWVQ